MFLINFYSRSEYCRNVKLKFCLEANTPWAEEYRERLGKKVVDGGFTGLYHLKYDKCRIMYSVAYAPMGIKLEK